ncbi:tissue inhibitor of metalloproteinase [Bactrocera oleae]|uniref:tissue inhibitor of metalloproteinase n=1 Tax=Bactrocera oleae TaxID=104688 RepID=UPI0006B86454|nr:tissue inhibitor of metalloproteinase [Bactrocera oleae]XP_036224720.1 tissue inhibitor of metalloproteinase [Bactrocera oleae]XP_036224721.1 tissue inhibitor of metalloproteinase [Bactrocera oleae]
MDVGKYLGLLALMLLSLLALYSSPVEACSCMPSHPQTHFCNADYVVIIRVMRKSLRLVQDKIAYKVEVKKSYKMNEAGHKLLKHGRIVTPNSDAMCGINLDIGKLYVIAGRGPYLNSCSYVKEYQKMSVIERRGFAGAYRKGCKCSVQPCFGQSCLSEHQSATSCKWSPFAKCETDYSACIPSHYRTPEGIISKCHWRRTPAYKKCMSDP